MVSLCSPGCSGTCSVDHAGLEPRDLPASAFQMLGVKGRTHHLSQLLPSSLQEHVEIGGLRRQLVQTGPEGQDPEIQ